MLETASSLTPLQAIVLGAVQGLTELLPVSSSAHLYLVPTVLGWRYEGLAFDVALHAGTLAAVLLAFWRDWWALARDVLAPDAVRRGAAVTTWLKLAVGTLPAAVAGKLLDRLAETELRAVPLQAATLFGFGLLLWLVDRFRPAGRDDAAPPWRTVVFVGLAQCLALVPGVSRSGITMTAGRSAGLSRSSAARFSFMLAAPITLGALVLKLPDLPREMPLLTMALGVLSSAAFGLLAIRVLMRLLGRGGFGVFFAYRAILALGLVIWWMKTRA